MIVKWIARTKTAQIAPLHLALYLALLGMGYLSAGWLLAAFQVPWWGWLGTQAIALHVIRSEADGIALASGWIIGMMAIGVVRKSWAPVWGRQVPWEQAQVWALGLLGVWLWAMVLMVLLAIARPWLRTLGFTLTRQGLAVLTGASLGLGWILYQLGYGGAV